MHYYATVLTLLLPLTLCNAFNLIKQREDSWDLSCSADDSSASTTDWSTTAGWNNQMIACMGQMDNSGWNGAECKPTTDGKPTSPALGPSFGFWKGETHNTDGQNCYNLCSQCLATGINEGHGVTTSCTFTSYIAWGPAVAWTCNMGFDYGT